MRCNHDVWRCACPKRAAQVPGGCSAGPRSPFGRNRSGSQGARGRHCGNAQNPASKSHTNCCAAIAARENSGSNNRVRRAILRRNGKPVDCNSNFKPITRSRFNRIFRWAVVSTVVKTGQLRWIRSSAYCTSCRRHPSQPTTAPIGRAAIMSAPDIPTQAHPGALEDD